MKKFVSALLAAMMMFALTACGDDDSGDVSSNAPDTFTISVESGDTAVPLVVDVSHMTNPFYYGTLIIDLPKGFVSDPQTNQDAGMVIAYKGDSTKSTDCFTFDDTGTKDDIEDADINDLTESYKEQFESFQQFDVFEKTKFSGHDALSLGFELEIMGARIFQRQLYIYTDKTTYVINYTTEKEGNLKDYDQSISSIMIK